MAITAEQLRKLVNYDPETGIFTWLERPIEMFGGRKYSPEWCFKKWNLQFAGKPCGSVRKDGCFRIRIWEQSYYAGRLAWLYVKGEWPEFEIDHWNLNKSDNSWDNLRHATPYQNKCNRTAQNISATGIKGVSPSPTQGKFVANIRVNGLQKYLGTFPSIEEASAVYAKASAEFHGEFGRT